MNQEKLERISDAIQIQCELFMVHFGELLGIFRGRINQEQMKKIDSVWMIVTKASTPSSIIKDVAPYFLHFREEVESDNAEAMLNFDYSSLIVDGCEKNTASLIVRISNEIKEVYKKGNDNLQAQIKNIVRELVRDCAIYNKLESALKKI